MLCSECGSNMRLTTEVVKEKFRGEEFEIDGVEHYVCDNCGETSFDAAAIDKLYTIIEEEYPRRHGCK